MRRSRAGPAPKIQTENMNPFNLQMQGSVGFPTTFGAKRIKMRTALVSQAGGKADPNAIKS